MAKIRVTKGSDNVFADIGIPNAKEHKEKVKLVKIISQTIKKLRITAKAAAQKIGIKPNDLKNILAGKIRNVPINGEKGLYVLALCFIILRDHPNELDKTINEIKRMR